MIKQIESLSGILDFVHSFDGDPNFSSPGLATPELFACNLTDAVSKPDKLLLGACNAETLTGLFSLYLTRENRYIEVGAALSRDRAAEAEFLAYLRSEYPGWQADFILNPKDFLLREALQTVGASFFPVQRQFVLGTPAPFRGGRTVIPYAEDYREAYIAMHTTEIYWTAERVLAVPNRFHVFLALDGTRLVGYIDVTWGFSENEPFDLLVREEDRGQGYGRALLEAAIQSNGDKALGLLVDCDNTPAIALYQSAGFVEEPTRSNLTASLEL